MARTSTCSSAPPYVGTAKPATARRLDSAGAAEAGRTAAAAASGRLSRIRRRMGFPSLDGRPVDGTGARKVRSKDVPNLSAGGSVHRTRNGGGGEVTTLV